MKLWQLRLTKELPPHTARPAVEPRCNRLAGPSVCYACLLFSHHILKLSTLFLGYMLCKYIPVI